MFSWKLGRREASVDSAMVGIAIIKGEVTLVAFEGEVEDRPRMVAWQTIAADSPLEIQSGIKRFVDENGLQGWACRCTLSPEDYSLRLVERPTNVPDEELVDATRWLVRDLIEFDVEQAELAILTIPEDSTRARTPRMFVVAARHEPVADLAQAIEASGLCLVGFDTVECSMLALETRMPQVVAGSAALRIDEKNSVLTLSNSNRLYLARTLHIDTNAIESAAQDALNDTDPTNPAVVGLLDPLLLDVQRSLDYYESEYGQATASRLTLLPSDSDLTPLMPSLSEALRPIQVETYDLRRYFEMDEPPPTHAHPAIALASGAAIAGPGLFADALVPASFKGSSVRFGLSSALRLAVAFAVLLGIYVGGSWFLLDQERERLGLLENDRERAVAEADSLRANIAARSSQVDPETRIQALRTERDARMSLLRALDRRRTTPEGSFSKLLTGLARQDLEGVWLERIEFTEGGDSITIEGRSLKAEDVPGFLRRLGTERSFEQRNFRTFEIARQDTSTPGLAFRIATLGEKTESDGESP